MEGSYCGKTRTYPDVTLSLSSRGENRLKTPGYVPADMRTCVLQGSSTKEGPRPAEPRGGRGPSLPLPAPHRRGRPEPSPGAARCASGDTAPPGSQPNSHPERQLLVLISWGSGFWFGVASPPACQGCGQPPLRFHTKSSANGRAKAS